MKYLNKLLVLVALVTIGFASCKKKDEVAPLRDRLIGTWIGDRAVPNITAAGLDLSSLGINEPVNIDTLSMTVNSDGTFTSNVSGQNVNGQWALENNDTQLRLSGFNYNVGIVGGIDFSNVVLPETFNIDQLSETRMVLRTSFEQTLSNVPGLPIPIPVTATIELKLSFNKQ
ncbi:MAG TPA: hypothetical protein DCS93_29795 [Microscillaceae bacterium]|nr:hypothetical protein [Microscillaceae bacterium]